MKITLHNYQAFILDYYEARLSVEDSEELMQFLSAYPDCMKEFEEFELLFLQDEVNEFEGKEALKKRTKVSDEEYFSLVEGDVTVENKVELSKIISGDAVNEREFKLWAATVLTPDLSVRYPNKEELKKRRTVVVPLWQNVYFRAAATFIFALLGIAVMFLALVRDLETANGLTASASRTGKFSIHGMQDNISAVNSEEQNESEINSQHKNNENFSKENRNVLPVNKTLVAVTDTGKKADKENNLPENKKETIVIENNNSNSLQNMYAITSHSTEQIAVWEPEEGIAEAGTKRSVRKRMLDFAVTCLHGLKRIGVKKADAVKKSDPESGATDYILVFGDRSYSTTQN